MLKTRFSGLNLDPLLSYHYGFWSNHIRIHLVRDPTNSLCVFFVSFFAIVYFILNGSPCLNFKLLFAFTVSAALKFLPYTSIYKWKHYFVGILMVTLVSIQVPLLSVNSFHRFSQYYYVFQASLEQLPTQEAGKFRIDCLESERGGKRSLFDSSVTALNPCFCKFPSCSSSLSLPLRVAVLMYGLKQGE